MKMQRLPSEVYTSAEFVRIRNCWAGRYIPRFCGTEKHIILLKKTLSPIRIHL